MAIQSLKLYMTKCGYINEENPDNHYVIDTSAAYDIHGTKSEKRRKLFLFSFDPFPAALRYNALYGIQATFKIQAPSTDYYQSVDVAFGSPVYDFDENTVTFNNSIAYNDNSAAAYLKATRTAQDVSSNAITASSGDSTRAHAQAYLRCKSLALTSAYGNTSYYLTYVWPRLSNGTLPYITAYYDDAILQTGAAKFVYDSTYTPSSGDVEGYAAPMDPTAAYTVNWKTAAANASIHCVAESFTQTSATLYWSYSSDYTPGSFTFDHSISISGDTTSYQFPANTFQSGKTVYFCIETTDDLSRTTRSQIMAVQTREAYIKALSAPTGGYVNPRNPVSISWQYRLLMNGKSTAAAIQDDKTKAIAAGATSLLWRVSGADTWNEIQYGSGVTSATIPANTFPTASTIEWKLSGTDITGGSAQSVVTSSGGTTLIGTFSFSTTAGTATATAISPSDTVVDGSKPITFRWSLSSSDGQAPSLVNLWWKLPSEDNQHWHVIISSQTPITSYTVPEGYFNAGEIQWLVHAYNIDEVRGPDSRASFICVAAPSAPTVSATTVPFTTITWQGSGQQAYRIAIDGEEVVRAFGSDYNYTVKEPLTDGSHTIDVSIQGVYGLWSNNGSTTITIENNPDDTLSLFASFDLDAVLTWVLNSGETSGDFYIYRDGVRIGHTSGMSFTDRLAFGEHSYHVLNRSASGNYVISSDVIGKMTADCNYIAPLSGGDWIPIKLSENSAKDQPFSYSTESALITVMGVKYPVLEIGPHEEAKVTFDCAFASREDARAFEAMRGRVVIVKGSEDTLVVGGLTILSGHKTVFYTGYTFTLQRIHYEDYRDDA